MTSAQILETNEEGNLRSRVRDLARYWAPLFSMALLLLAYTMGPAIVMLLKSPLDGVWMKQSGDRQMPDEIKVEVKRDRFTETFAARTPVLGYEQIALIANGEEHPWIESGSLPGAAWISYRAKLTKTTFALTELASSGARTQTSTELWTVRNSGRELVVERSHQQTIYRRASWFRSLFTSAP